MKALLKYLFSYVLVVAILVISFSKGFFEIDYDWIVAVILTSMVFALFPIFLYISFIKAKIWLPVILFIIFSSIVFYLYIQTQEGKFSTWFKEEQIRQLLVLAVMIVVTMVVGLYKKTSLKQASGVNPQ